MLNASILRRPVLIPLIILVILAAGIGFFMSAASYDWQGLVLVASAIGIAGRYLLPCLSRLEDWSSFSRILTAGLLLRLGFSMLLIWASYVFYGGFNDVALYHHSGIAIAQHMWRLEFDQVVPFLQWGTNFVAFFTGFIYFIVGPTLYGNFLIYAFLAFLGSYCFYRAFLIIFPQGNRKLYAVLVFFFPSILFWANGIGKDALMFLGIGLFAYGSAQLTREQWRGLLPLTLGLLGTLFIRPHIALALALAFILAFLVRGTGKRAVRSTTVIIGLLVVVVLGWFLLPRVMTYIGLNELSPQGVLELFQQQQSNTLRGGSAFQVMNLKNPLTYPMGIITLFFRPFPWEAHNLQALIQSLEGVLFISLVLWRIKSLGKALASSISNTYLRFILIYSIAFVIAFSTIANFGLLARERTMLLPFFFMFIAYSPFHTHPEDKVLEVTVQ